MKWFRQHKVKASIFIYKVNYKIDKQLILASEGGFRWIHKHIDKQNFWFSVYLSNRAIITLISLTFDRSVLKDQNLPTLQHKHLLNNYLSC